VPINARQGWGCDRDQRAGTAARSSTRRIASPSASGHAWPHSARLEQREVAHREAAVFGVFCPHHAEAVADRVRLHGPTRATARRCGCVRARCR
jgi:hypothetical protein